MLEYDIGNLEDFIKNNWCPTIISYSESDILNTDAGIYMGFVDVNTIPDLILRMSIKRHVPDDVCGQVVFMAHEFIFQWLGFHTEEIQESILDNSDKLVEWQIRFIDTIREFDKTHELTVQDIFILILLGLDPRKNRLTTTENSLLEFSPISEETDNPQEGG